MGEEASSSQYSRHVHVGPDTVVSDEGAGRQGTARTLSKRQLHVLGSTKLADCLLDACHRHEDVAAMVAEVLAKSGLMHGDAAVGHAGEPMIVGQCRAMQGVFKAIRRYATADAPLLITGESGTGKELAALAVHERSDFADGPFVAINCGGLPANLIASELFGHEKGAFTGATSRRVGHIEAADGGTLFLDEIGDMPLDLQANFLRFLETRTIERLGGNKSFKVNARIIAATNVDLEAAVKTERFRRDLFYRLDVLRIRMPALRERAEDIELLVKFFVQQACQELGTQERLVHSRAIAALKAYAWPGNVRELISKIRRAVVMAEEEMLDVGDFELDECAMPAVGYPRSATGSFGQAPAELADLRAEAEARAIGDSLERHRYNVSAAAKELNISRTTMYKTMRRLGLGPHST